MISSPDSQKIFITVSEGSIARNILRSFVLERLLERPGSEIFLLVPEDKREAYQKEFGSARVSILPWRGVIVWRFFEKVLSYFARNGLKTETILTDQRTYSSGLSFWLKRSLTNTLGRSAFFHRLIRWLDRFRPASGTMSVFFEEHHPELLFATDVQDELDLDAMAAARTTNTPVVGMIRSWDNPTSSAGLVRVIPDTLLVWNPYIKRQMMKFQDISQEKIVVTGIPHFDWYGKEEMYCSREEFARQFGLDPAKKILLFAGIGTFLNPHESETVELVSEALKSGKLPDDVQILFRPHPNFLIEKERIDALGNVIFDNTVATYTGSERTSWEMDRNKIAHLVNSLRHADVVVTTASTMTIDAVAFDKPVVCVAFDGKSEEPYFKSVRRFYHDYTHYIEISKTKGFKIATSKEDLVHYINEYVRYPEHDADGRIRLREEFIGNPDGKSSERLADVLMDYP